MEEEIEQVKIKMQEEKKTVRAKNTYQRKSRDQDDEISDSDSDAEEKNEKNGDNTLE